MSEHTKEPWNGKNIPLTASALERAGFYIVFTNNPATKDEAEANARRIVACVNACEGIPTGVLEKQGMVPIEQVTHDIEQQRDKLLDTLKECLPYIDNDQAYNNAVAVMATGGEKGQS